MSTMKMGKTEFDMERLNDHTMIKLIDPPSPRCFVLCRFHFLSPDAPSPLLHRIWGGRQRRGSTEEVGVRREGVNSVAGWGEWWLTQDGMIRKTKEGGGELGATFWPTGILNRAWGLGRVGNVLPTSAPLVGGGEEGEEWELDVRYENMLSHMPFEKRGRN